LNYINKILNIYSMEKQKLTRKDMWFEKLFGKLENKEPKEDLENDSK